MNELQELLSTMDIPQGRKTDLRWLARNLAIRNGENPNFEKANNLINRLLFVKQ